MSIEQDVQDIIDKLASLQVQQADLTQELARLTQEADANHSIRSPARVARRNTTPSAPANNLPLGTRVRIRNPNPGQARFGTVTDIGKRFITIRAANGTEVKREPHNVVRDNEFSP
jgi:hypothetical protein